jgi:hypothetical protein
VYQTISRGFVNLLNAKKIQDTKFPFPYVQVMHILLIAHMVLMPMMMATIIQSKILCVITSVMPMWGALCLNFIAQELENPFGTDKNDLPLENFQIEMNNCLMMLLHPNTDIIASISPRCEMDFHRLRANHRMSHKPDSDCDQNGKKLSRKRTRRLSDFGHHGSGLEGRTSVESGADDEEVQESAGVQVVQRGSGTEGDSSARSTFFSSVQHRLSTGSRGSRGTETESRRRQPSIFDADLLSKPSVSFAGDTKDTSKGDSKSDTLKGIALDVGDEPLEAERNAPRSEAHLPALMASGPPRESSEQSEATPTAMILTGPAPTVQTDSLQPLLAKTTAELVASLQEWTVNIERQVDDLNTNSMAIKCALRRFEQSFPGHDLVYEPDERPSRTLEKMQFGSMQLGRMGRRAPDDEAATRSGI